VWGFFAVVWYDILMMATLTTRMPRAAAKFVRPSADILYGGAGFMAAVRLYGGVRFTTDRLCGGVGRSY